MSEPNSEPDSEPSGEASEPDSEPSGEASEPSSEASEPSSAGVDASEPSFAVSEEDKEQIPPHMRSDLVLSRIHHYRDTIRSYQVLVDGQKVGTVRDDKSETFTLRPGTYVVRLKLLWIYSPKVEVVLPPAGETHLLCGPNGGIMEAWRLIVAPMTAIFLRHTKPDGSPNELPAGSPAEPPAEPPDAV